MADVSQQVVNRIVYQIAERFRVFGGGATSADNPLAAALQDRAPMFAAGVDVEEVVRFVLAEAGAADGR